MEFETLVQTARSCRRFHQEQRIDKEMLHGLVDLARVAPCARNAQVLRYAIAESEKACAHIYPHTRWAAALKWDGPLEGERPSAYIAILTPENSGKLVHFDVGIAAQTIQLGAQSKGIGCCMLASFKQKEVKDIYSIPEGFEIALVLGLGVEKEIRALANMKSHDDFMYWRDENNVHFVPKRSLEDVIFCCI